jgi:hypothetical protein
MGCFDILLDVYILYKGDQIMSGNLSHVSVDDQKASRWSVNLSLNVTHEELKEEQKKLDEVLNAINAFHATHGFISDEFSTL